VLRATLDTPLTSRDVLLLPEFSQAGPSQAPAEPAADRPDVVPPVSDFAVDAAEFLNRFLPFDPNRFQAEVDGFFAGIDSVVPELEDILTSPESWVAAAAIVGLYASRRRAKGRRQASYSGPAVRAQHKGPTPEHGGGVGEAGSGPSGNPSAGG